MNNNDDIDSGIVEEVQIFEEDTDEYDYDDYDDYEEHDSDVFDYDEPSVIAVEPTEPAYVETDSGKYLFLY